jgi:hypothetical protein
MTSQDKKYFEELITKLQKESRLETDELVAKLQKDSDEEIKHYIGGLMEQYNWNLEAILENTRDLPRMREKIDMLFENMGLQEVDITILKEAVRDHAKRLEKIETR